MVRSSLAPIWPILAPFHGMDYQKCNFSLISGTLSVGGCWGQLMLLFWKIVVVPKNSLSQHSRTIFKPSLTCIFLSVRANSKSPFQNETHPVVLAHETSPYFKLFLSWSTPFGMFWSCHLTYFMILIISHGSYLPLCIYLVFWQKSLFNNIFLRTEVKGDFNIQGTKYF